MRKLLKGEKGQSLVLIALALVALLGFTAVAVDVGTVEMQKAKLQSAIDAASLAAAQSLPDTVAATAAANSYVEKNGFSSSDIAISFSNGNMRVSITAAKEVPYTFAQVLGVSSATINNVAAAEKQAVAAPSPSPGGGGGAGFDYVLFSYNSGGGKKDKVTFNGGGTRITGNIHTNYKFDFNGNDLVVNGRAEAVSGLDGINANVKLSNPIPNAPSVEMPSFSVPGTVPPTPTGVTWTTVNPGWQGGGDYVISSPIYFNGDFNADCGGKVRITGNGCVIATGSISMGGTTIDTNNPIALQSLNGSISFSETTDMTGGAGSIIAYNDVTFNGSPFTINTSNSVAVRSVNGNINCNNTLSLTGGGCMIAKYDINLRGGTVTVATTTHPDMYSTNGNINFTNSNEVNGIIYAPNGTISLSGGSFTITGSLIANYISIGNKIIGQAGSFGGGGPTPTPVYKIKLVE